MRHISSSTGRVDGRPTRDRVFEKDSALVLALVLAGGEQPTYMRRAETVGAGAWAAGAEGPVPAPVPKSLDVYPADNRYRDAPVSHLSDCVGTLSATLRTSFLTLAQGGSPVQERSTGYRPR